MASGRAESACKAAEASQAVAQRRIALSPSSAAPGSHLELRLRGPPEYIRSDNGPEFTAHRVRDWLENAGVRTLFIEPGSPWENGFIESFNGKLRDELLNREIFDTPLEARVLIERWRVHCNTVRLHSSPGYRPPAPEAVLTARQAIRLPLNEWYHSRGQVKTRCLSSACLSQSGQ